MSIAFTCSHCGRRIAPEKAMQCARCGKLVCRACGLLRTAITRLKVMFGQSSDSAQCARAVASYSDVRRT